VHDVFDAQTKIPSEKSFFGDILPEIVSLGTKFCCESDWQCTYGSKK